MKAVGLYPYSLLHRRNTDYLYHRALSELYTRIGHSWQIVRAPSYELLANLIYLAHGRLLGKRRWAAAAGVASWMRRVSLPRKYRDAAVYHAGFLDLPRGLPVERVILEREFYLLAGDFTPPPNPALHAIEQRELETLIHTVVVRTELSAAHFRQQFPAHLHGKTKVVPFYMPYLERWEKQEPQRAATGRPTTYLFVGNQARRKGLDVFLGLRREVLAAGGTDSRFVVVSNFQDGEGSDLEGVEVRRGLSGVAVQELMAEADYFVLPTRADSHPKVLYEAAAVGCAFITSDIRPLRDIWSEAGYILGVDAGAEELVQLARQLVRPGQRMADHERGVVNRRRFLAEFCPSVAMAKYGEIIRSIVDSGSPR
jgi:glycosyltransferase involved in cell wall biosynthesis